MSQTISALFNFFLEIGRSGDQYKTRRTKSRAYIIVALVIGLAGAYGLVSSFGTVYKANIQVVKIKAEMAAVKETNKQLFEANARLEIRNEILSQTLGMYIGKSMVEKLNNQGKPPDSLPPLDPDTDVMPLPNPK
jgi:hypothetical protein